MVTPPMNLVTYEFMSGWAPFWNVKGGSSKDIAEETSRVRRQLEIYRGGKDDGEKEEKIRQETLQEVAAKLTQEAHTAKMEGYREFIFFLLNSVAFYGYLMGIVCFYFEEDFENEPAWLRSFKFGHTHDLADWHGMFRSKLLGRGVRVQALYDSLHVCCCMLSVRERKLCKCCRPCLAVSSVEILVETHAHFFSNCLQLSQSTGWGLDVDNRANSCAVQSILLSISSAQANQGEGGLGSRHHDKQI